jgi:hypothetical protein
MPLLQQGSLAAAGTPMAACTAVGGGGSSAGARHAGPAASQQAATPVKGAADAELAPLGSGWASGISAAGGWGGASATTALQLQLAKQMLSFATQQAALLQQALPFMLPVCPTKVSEKLSEVLEQLQAGDAMRQLEASGLSHAQAQRACLDFATLGTNGKLKPLDTKRVVKYYARKGTAAAATLDRWARA